MSEDVYHSLSEFESCENICLDDVLQKSGGSEIQMLAEQDILLHSKDYPVENSFRELNISLIPTLACNMNCNYCYSKRKSENVKTPIGVVKQAIEFFCSNYPFSICRIDFVSGGEPLYDSTALREIVDVLSDTLESHQKKVLFWLCTNGLLLSEPILKYLDKKSFNIGISLDGPADINDANRIDLGGNGTYQRVVQRISQIQNNTDLSRNIKNLWNCAVVTSQTDSLVKVLSNSYQLGFRNLQMKIAWSNIDDMRLPEQSTLQLYNELTEYLFDLVVENRIEEFLSICNENDTYGKILLRLIIQSGTTRRCNAGVNKFSISPEGDIYPCDSFMGIKKYSIGNIYTGFNEVYDEFNTKRSGGIISCKKCWARYLCGGDCYFHAYLNNNDPWQPDETVCHIVKGIAEMCIRLIVSLYREYPDKMQTIYGILSKKVIRMEPQK